MLVPVLGIYYPTTRSTKCLQTSGGKILNYDLTTRSIYQKASGGKITSSVKGTDVVS